MAQLPKFHITIKTPIHQEEYDINLILEKIKSHSFDRNILVDQIGNTKGTDSVVLDHDLLTTLFTAYDHHVFDELIRLKINELKLGLILKISDKMTNSAGTFKVKNGSCVITISKPVIDGIDPEQMRLGLVKSSGLVVKNKIHAIMITFEHELTHLIVRLFATKPDDISQSHGPLFKKIVDHFGHTTITHQLFNKHMPTTSPISILPTFNHKWSIGDAVVYLSTNKEIHGYISKLNPTNAKVTCENGQKYSIKYCALALDIAKSMAVTSTIKPSIPTLTSVTSTIKPSLSPVTSTIKPPTPVPLTLTLTPKSNHQWAIDDLVICRCTNRVIQGHIIKLNPTSAKIMCNDKSVYSVKYSALEIDNQH